MLNISPALSLANLGWLSVFKIPKKKRRKIEILGRDVEMMYCAATETGFEDIAGREILEELKTIDVTTMTAIDAMNKLYQLSNKAKETDV